MRPPADDAGSSVNDVSGTIAGPSIQAVDIFGGVHFHGSAAAPGGMPRQGAGPIPHFTGRGSELDLLRRAAAGPGSRLVVLSGPGGVGKTALARQWADETAEAFPAGSLYAGLGGFGTGPPTDPAEVLRAFLRALAVPAEGMPASLPELTALYRSHTAGKSLLVVLDDAYSSAQARVLLPAAPSSMTVVTSRNRLSALVADGARFIDVGPLTADESVALLANVLGPERIDREPDQAGRLAGLCAGLPIALTLAAARLAVRPRLTMARLVSALSDETERLAGLSTPDEEVSVRGSIESSYRALDRPTAALYRRLSLHPGREFGLLAVVALMPGIQLADPAARAERLVDALLDANLLQEIAEDRFRYHDLIRLHARQKAFADDTEEAADGVLLAILERYLGTASTADVIVTPYRWRLDYTYRTAPGPPPAFRERADALDWLDRERVNLSAAAQAALDRRWAELAWQLSDAVRPLQLFRKSTDRKEIDERGLAAARMWGDPRAEADMLTRLGRTYTTLGEWAAAEDLLRLSIARCAGAGDAARGVEAQEMLALLFRDAGREDEAMSVLHEVVTTRRRSGDDRAVGLSLINLAELVSRRGRAGEAVDFLREAGELLGRSSGEDPYNPVRVRIGLAHAYFELGDLDAADREAAAAADGMRGLGAAPAEAEAMELAGKIAERRGEPERRRSCLRRAEELLESYGSPRAAAIRQLIDEPPGEQQLG